MSSMKGSDTFGLEMRGYDKAQVDEYVARTREHIAALEQQLERLAAENEQLRRERESS